MRTWSYFIQSCWVIFNYICLSVSLRVSKIRFHDGSGWTAIQNLSMYSQRCPRTKRQLVCIFKHPVPSSYSADTDTTMHFKAHCLSSGPFMIMQPAKIILAKVASDGRELSDHKASVAFCSVTIHIRNVCFKTVLILLSTEGVSAFPGFLIFEHFIAVVYLFNYHIMNKY